MKPLLLTSCLESDGFFLLRHAFAAMECDRFQAEWDAACASGTAGLIRSATGSVYGARNILDLWPGSVRVMDQPALANVLGSVLGPGFGLVRVLFFDKPPGESWALPWHKDMAIAVRDNALPSKLFGRPTSKYGVPHVEAPVWLLERMLTARLHLDDVTDENGPLRVLPGSHRSGKESGSGEVAVSVLCDRGDMLLMRPLVSHASGHSRVPDRHRRILHLEFSGVRDLPDGYAWHTFIAARRTPQATNVAAAAPRSRD